MESEFLKLCSELEALAKSAGVHIDMNVHFGPAEVELLVRERGAFTESFFQSAGTLEESAHAIRREMAD